MKRRAFTLIEMLVVIILIVVLAAMIVPTYHSGVESMRARGNLERLTGMLNMAGALAAEEAQPHRVLFDHERGVFQIVREEDPLESPGDFTPVLMSAFGRHQLDAGMRVRDFQTEREPEEGERENLAYIEFRPDGTADRSILILETDTGDRFWSITVAPLTAAVRVYEQNLLEEGRWP